MFWVLDIFVYEILLSTIVFTAKGQGSDEDSLVETRHLLPILLSDQFNLRCILQYCIAFHVAFVIYAA